MSCALPPPDEKKLFPTFKRLRHTPLRDVLRGRVTARLDWEASLARSGLPAPAREIVAQVVKRTKLWRLEKAQVCDELVAHFGDGLAAGETTEELLKNFGDIRRTAQLIRRAKKRQRPLVWHGLKWMGRGLLALVVVYAGLTVYYAMDKVVIRTDYLAEMNKVALETPESERAWPVYREGIAKLRDEMDSYDADAQGHPKNFSAMVYDPPKPTDPNWAVFDQGMRKYQREILLYRQAAAKPHLGAIGVLGTLRDDYVAINGEKYSDQYTPPRNYQTGISLAPDQVIDSDMLFGVLLPHMGAIRGKVCWPLCADLRWASARGDSASAIADAEALLNVGRQLSEHPVLIAQLVGLSINAETYRQIEQVLRSFPQTFDGDDLAKLALIVSLHPVPPCSYKGEQLWFNDFIQHTYTDDGHGNGHATSALEKIKLSITQEDWQARNNPSQWAKFLKEHPSVDSWRIHLKQAPLSLLSASRRELQAESDALFTELEKEARIPLREHPESSVQRQLDEWEHSAWKRIRFAPILATIPVFTVARVQTEKAQALHSSLQLGLALHRHKLAHGTFPAQLALLVPTYLPELPVDPITGGPLHYRLDDKGNPIVYSVGADRKDDGGYAPVNRAGEDDTQATQRWDDKNPVSGDWILWPMRDRPLMKGK